MTWRTNATLLTIAILLTLYFRIYETDPPSWDGKGRIFRTLQPESISEIVITSNVSAEDAELGVTMPQIVLRYVGENGDLPKWWIVEPFRFAAFHPRAQAIAYELAEIVRVSEVTGEEVVSDEEFTLNVRATMRTGEEFELAIGRDHRDNTIDLCIARARDDVFWIRQRSRQKFVVTLEDLRERALFSFASEDVESIEVAGSPRVDKQLMRVPGGSDWRLVRPNSGPADREHTEELLKDLNSWSITEFVSDEPIAQEVLKEYGLGSPSSVVTVKKRDGSEITLAVGHERTAEKQVYVRHVGSNHIFLAGAEPLANLRREAQYYRNRFVFDLQLDEVAEVRGEVLRGARQGRQFTLRRIPLSEQQRGEGTGPTASASQDAWEVSDGFYNMTFPGDGKIIERFLLDLRRLPIEKYIDSDELGSTGVEDPQGILMLTLDSGRTLELTVGNRSEDPIDSGSSVFYVKRPDEPGAYLVLTTVPLLLDEGGHAFRDRELSDIEPTQVVEVTVRADDRQFSVMRPPGEREWTLPKGQSVDGLNVNPDLIGRLVLRFHPDTLRAIRYYPEAMDPEPLGLNKVTAPWSVTVRTQKNDAQLRTLYVGKPVDGTKPLEYYATVDGKNVPFFSVDEEWVKVLQNVYQHLQAVSRD